jgi:DUF4097 and DUF4098 domain-containing protein YvlB
MPTFATPMPIAVALDVSRGQVTIVASERADTVVQVSPGNKAKGSDLKAADNTHVDCSEGKLVVESPKQLGLKAASIEVTIELPTGSSLHAKVGKAGITTKGTLGRCQLQTEAGPIQLDSAESLDVASWNGHIAVEHVIGQAEVRATSREVRIGKVDGPAVIKAVNGDIWVGCAADDLNVSTANGSVAIERAEANVTAKTAGGSVRVGRIVRGNVELANASGDLSIGISEGTAAWIDAESKTGAIHKTIADQDGPDEFIETVKVRARTKSGDITIHPAT